FASLVRNASDVVTVVEIDSTITYASPSAHGALGDTSGVVGRAHSCDGGDEFEGTLCAAVVHDEDKTRALSFMSSTSEGEDVTATLEFRVRRSDGSFIYAKTQRTNLLHDPTVHGIVLTTRDVSERREFEEQLSHQAFHDSLTGLENRVLFRDRVSHGTEPQGAGEP